MKPDPNLALLPLMLDRVPFILKQMLQQEGVPISTQTHEESVGQFVLWDSARNASPILHEGQIPIDVASLRQQRDVFRLLQETEAAKHQWRIQGITISEMISKINRGPIRRLILAQLRKIIEASGGVWLRVSPYPFPYQSAFNFRIDYDEYDAEHFENVMTLVEQEPNAFSHFVCASSYENHPDSLKRFKHLDTGSHGYWHHTYRTREENQANIERGIDTLEDAGIRTSGFVAPEGVYHPTVMDTLESLNVTHSSEFSLAYDDFPFFPENRSVLQLPIHPVCLGIFLESEQHRTGNTKTILKIARDYFRQVMRRKYRAGDPIFLYGHPTGRLGRYPRLLQSILKEVNSYKHIWKTTMTEFGAWWRGRQDAEILLYQREDRYTVFIDAQVVPYRLSMEVFHENKVANFEGIPPLLHFTMDQLKFRPQQPLELQQPQRIDPPIKLRDMIKHHLDWETVTPPDEIKDRTWRGWGKWVLRNLRKAS